MPTLIVRVRDVYGEAKVYPVCPVSKVLAELSGHKTLTRQCMHLVRLLGYGVQIEWSDCDAPRWLVEGGAA